MSKPSNRILVVDDDPDIGIMIKMMLEYKGYSVTLAERPEKATAMLKNERFDLMIMDMLLSGANGTDICIKTKQDRSTSKLPIIMISAHPNAMETCIKAGADDFISKPFDMQVMLSKIQKFIQPED